MKRFLFSLVALALFAIAPASANVFRDGNWVGANGDGTSPAEWKALDAQHRAYSAAKESGHEALAKGEYTVAAEFYEKAAANAIWSWTQAWQLNNAAYALVKSLNHEDGLSSQERADLERALAIFEECLSACDKAEKTGKKLDQVEKCRAKVEKSSNAVRRTLGQ